MTAQFRAPTANGAVLAEPHFAALPALVEANRERLNSAPVRIGGLPLPDLRALARREALERAGSASDGALRPLLLAGHQPELSHPGVWVKNFALNGLARKLGCVPLHLVVDNDTLKSTALRFPVWNPNDPRSVRLESVNFDAFAGEVAYEDRAVRDAEAFRTFPARAAPVWANWPHEPLLANCWRTGTNVGDAFTQMRRGREREWGCHNLELSVSALSQTRAFARFAAHILNDLPRFRACYNRAIRAYRDANGVRSANHPAPELEEGEAPFWVRTGEGKRQRATATSDVTKLRPRALTLTLFARVCLGDFFIHGIGGGKYDEVTDAIIRDYFGISPPAYQVLSATLHLPLPAFAATRADEANAARRVRDLRWNPHKFLPSEHATERERLCASEPPREAHAARREWFRALQKHTEALRPLVADQLPAAESHLAQVRAECDANAILHRRDFAWVLYPEDVLRAFLQNFLA